MGFTTLGRTGLKVSVAGLGCGGHSRLGQTYGNSEAESVAVVDAALDMGINFIDTATVYRTEKIVGSALQGKRDQAIVSTKTQIMRRAANSKDVVPMIGADVRAALDASLGRLQTDYVDIYNLHGVVESDLDYVDAEIVPVLHDLQKEGKIRFLGITERFGADTGHAMLPPAIETGVWDVIMVGFNILNPSARTRVLARTRELNIGTQNMFAVRRALSNRDALADAIRKAVDAGQVDAGQVDAGRLDAGDPLGAIVMESGAANLVELAYRFCRHEPGIHVVLTGTGKVAHLKENVASINGAPLPEETLTKLADLFGAVDCLSGN